MRYHRRAAPVALLFAGALLAGCAASADPAATSSQAPSLPSSLETAGRTDLQTSAVPGAISARGGAFGVALPAQWRDETSEHADTVLFLKASDPADKVYPTFSVVRTSMKKVVALNTLVEQGMIAQRQKGATVSKLADRTVGGVPSAGYRITATTDGAEVVQTQFFVVRERTVFIATLTAAVAQEKPALGTQDAILSSWSWGRPPALPSSASSTSTPSPDTSSTPTGSPSEPTGSSRQPESSTPSSTSSDATRSSD